ncbi:hypothetical protein D1638_08505 [Muribaculaceae bacterium Z1]|nr:hypothetical protein [Muribaculaceae bacterium S4]NBI20953.1 hypothetical protein [Muribaculaceae bacterium Z1]
MSFFRIGLKFYFWELWELLGVFGSSGRAGSFGSFWESWELWELWEFWELWESWELWVLWELSELSELPVLPALPELSKRPPRALKKALPSLSLLLLFSQRNPLLYDLIDKGHEIHLQAGYIHLCSQFRGELGEFAVAALGKSPIRALQVSLKLSRLAIVKQSLSRSELLLIVRSDLHSLLL